MLQTLHGRHAVASHALVIRQMDQAATLKRSAVPCLQPPSTGILRKKSRTELLHDASRVACLQVRSMSRREFDQAYERRGLAGEIRLMHRQTQLVRALQMEQAFQRTALQAWAQGIQDRREAVSTEAASAAG